MLNTSFVSPHVFTADDNCVFEIRIRISIRIFFVDLRFVNILILIDYLNYTSIIHNIILFIITIVMIFYIANILRLSYKIILYY